MTGHPIRTFADDAAIVAIGEGLLARTLPKAEWTHEAHLAATLWLLTERPDIDVEEALPDIIRAYNVATGGVNDDSQGYHETVTRTYLHGLRTFLDAIHRYQEQSHDTLGLTARVNALLVSPMGQRDWPLRFYSKALLFSVTARRSFVTPDLRPMR